MNMELSGRREQRGVDGHYMDILYISLEHCVSAPSCILGLCPCLYPHADPTTLVAVFIRLDNPVNLYCRIDLPRFSLR